MSVRRRRLRSIYTLAVGGLTSFAIVATVGPATAAASGPGCQDLYACLWGQPWYDGVKVTLDGSTYGGTGWWPLGSHYNSAKNRYNARKLKLGRYTNGGNSIDVRNCLDPQDNRPDPGWFDAFHVSDLTNDRCPN